MLHALPSEAPRSPPELHPSALAGRLIELSGPHPSGMASAAVGLLLRAQEQGEPVAWVCTPERPIFPPDLADSGVDLEALVVVRAPDAAMATRAAERLLRSGAFGLLVVDLGRDPVVPMPLQTRLVGLAQKHACAFVCLTEKSAQAPSIGSLVSLRAEVQRTSVGPQRYSYELIALKDKRRGPGWSHREVCRGPAGLR